MTTAPALARMTLDEARHLATNTSSPDPVELLDLRGDVAEAMSFVARRYAGKWRKNPREKELDHAVRVAAFVRSLLGFGDASAVIVALLHDTLERTSVRYDQLAWCFGVEIADAVRELTKPHAVEAGSEAYEQYLDHLVGGSATALAVKTADLMDNLFSRFFRGDCRVILHSAKSFVAKVKSSPNHREIRRVIPLLEEVIAQVEVSVQGAEAA
jgi:(p)ppGpp synthase/HD superfamily hydrolase